MEQQKNIKISVENLSKFYKWKQQQKILYNINRFQMKLSLLICGAFLFTSGLTAASTKTQPRANVGKNNYIIGQKVNFNQWSNDNWQNANWGEKRVSDNAKAEQYNLNIAYPVPSQSWKDYYNTLPKSEPKPQPKTQPKPQSKPSPQTQPKPQKKPESQYDSWTKSRSQSNYQNHISDVMAIRNKMFGDFKPIFSGSTADVSKWDNKNVNNGKNNVFFDQPEYKQQQQKATSNIRTEALKKL